MFRHQLFLLKGPSSSLSFPPTLPKHKESLFQATTHLCPQKQGVSGPISLQSIPVGDVHDTNSLFFILYNNSAETLVKVGTNSKDREICGLKHCYSGHSIYQMKYSLIYQSTKKLIPDTNSYRHFLPSKEVDVGGLAKSKIFFLKMKTIPAQLQSTRRGITVQSIINSDSRQQKSYIISLSEYAVIRYEAGRYFLLKFSMYCHAKHNIF